VYSLDAGMLQDMSDSNQSIFKLLDIQLNDQQPYDKGLEKFSQWSFDAITYHATLQQPGFMIFCLKVISGNVAIKTLGIPLQPLLDFLKEIYSRMQNDTKSSQSAANLIDNLQALHYFLQAGNLKRYFSEADIFGLILSFIIYNLNNM
jgi:hypothetical protein